MIERLLSLLTGKPAKAKRAEPASPAPLSVPDLELVVPMVKVLVDDSGSQATSDELRLSFEQSPVSRPFAADLLIMYAVDRPNHLEYVSNAALAATRLDAEEIHAKAIANLPNRLENVQLHDCGQGIFGLSAGGTFEASLLLLDDLWVQLADRLPGEPLAAVPSRDLLFVVGSGQPGAIGLIAAKARIELAEKRYALSQSVLMRREMRWQAWVN